MYDRVGTAADNVCHSVTCFFTRLHIYIFEPFQLPSIKYYVPLTGACMYFLWFSEQSHVISYTTFKNCGNKMPTRWNRGFYCRSYCLLNMFRAPLCPSSGAQEYYTVVAACGISCCGFQVAGLVFPHINDDARSKSHQIHVRCCKRPAL